MNTMNTISRRMLLRSTAIIPATVLLAACASTTGTTSSPVPVSTFVTDTQAFGQYLLQQFLPTVTAAGTPIPPGPLQTITTIIQSIEGVANGIGAAASQTQGVSALQTIEGYVNNLAPVVSPFLSLIPGAGPILTIAFAALPALENLINFGVSLLTPAVNTIASAPVASVPGAAGVSLSPDQALQIILQRTGRSAGLIVRDPTGNVLLSAHKAYLE